MDAVRPDHLSCFGYDRVETAGIDEIAAEGAMFRNCVSASSLTPVTMASILTGSYPRTHGVRNPFTQLEGTSLAEVLSSAGYKTAGFTGIDFLSARNGYDTGFDRFDEPTSETAWNSKTYTDPESGDERETAWGNWWVDDLFEWIDDHSEEDFFAWGHYFECHVPAERWLLESGEIEPARLMEQNYYDAKVKYMDENLFQPLIELLKKLDLWEEVLLVVTSDHGETFHEHHHRDLWPQHQSLYNTDLQVPLFVKGGDDWAGETIDDQVRTIDIAPTVLSLLDLEGELAADAEGVDLGPSVEGSADLPNVAYSEELYRERGVGSLQAVQDGEWKLIRNVTTNEEEVYDLRTDPLEQNDASDRADEELLATFRDLLDEHLEGWSDETHLDDDDEAVIRGRLEDLGYI